jgi:hypothetical protein
MAGRRDHGQGDKRRGRDFSKEAGTYSHNCVNDFTTKSLINREETCIMRCVDKNLKSSARLNMGEDRWLMAGRRDHGQGDKRRGRDFSKEAGTYLQDGPALLR